VTLLRPPLLVGLAQLLHDTFVHRVRLGNARAVDQPASSRHAGCRKPRDSAAASAEALVIAETEDLEWLIAVIHPAPVNLRSAFLRAIVEVAEDKERRAGLRPLISPALPTERHAAV
jgi:hypothetical protein